MTEKNRVFLDMQANLEQPQWFENVEGFIQRVLEMLEITKQEISIVFCNDDYTTKDFVVDVLKKLYHKNESEAILIMEQVHQKGSAVVGIYTYDIALTRVEMTISLARKNGFPLRCEMSED